MNIQQAMQNVDEKTAKLFKEHQTLIRRSYLNAHIAILGANEWTYQDSENFETLDLMIVNMLRSSGHLIEQTPSVPSPGTFAVGRHLPKGEPLNKEQRDNLEQEIQKGLKT